MDLWSYSWGDRLWVLFELLLRLTSLSLINWWMAGTRAVEEGAQGTFPCAYHFMTVGSLCILHIADYLSYGSPLNKSSSKGGRVVSFSRERGTGRCRMFESYCQLSIVSSFRFSPQSTRPTTMQFVSYFIILLWGISLFFLFMSSDVGQRSAHYVYCRCPPSVVALKPAGALHRHWLSFMLSCCISVR